MEYSRVFRERLREELIADEGWMLYKYNLLKEYDGKLPVNGMHGYHSDGFEPACH